MYAALLLRHVQYTTLFWGDASVCRDGCELDLGLGKCQDNKEG